MKQPITIFFLLTITITAFSQTQSEMTRAASEKYLKADKELNNVYKQIQKEYISDTIFIKKLKIAQQLWIKFRDAELDMKFPEPNKRLYGSMYSMCASGYLEKLTKERTKRLKEWLQPVPRVEGCAGSVKYRERCEEEVAVEKIEDHEIVGLLNSVEVLKEFETSELIVKIMAVGSYSGSAGFPNGEVVQDLLVAVSEFDEVPKQNLFRISEIYNPELVAIDMTDESKPIIEITYGQRNRIKYQLSINELVTVGKK
ncbi:DUF1311 domain-containing protein [Puteibacter caeruleilacunae]|nr:DUF1311 domain-containing protein [Puteibacter caeruleilacunae]